jgi:hypothetical protein
MGGIHLTHLQARIELVDLLHHALNDSDFSVKKGSQIAVIVKG